MLTKRTGILIAGQALFTLLQTFLISKISLVGKLGITLIYREYSLLRSSWKTFSLLFFIQIMVILALSLAAKKLSERKAKSVAWLLIAAACFGLIVTYFDFLHTSHRLLRERFHLGFYLFWAGWIGSCVYFLTMKEKLSIVPAELSQDKRPDQV